MSTLLSILTRTLSDSLLFRCWGSNLASYYYRTHTYTLFGRFTQGVFTLETQIIRNSDVCIDNMI